MGPSRRHSRAKQHRHRYHTTVYTLDGDTARRAERAHHHLHASVDVDFDPMAVCAPMANTSLLAWFYLLPSKLTDRWTGCWVQGAHEAVLTRQAYRWNRIPYPTPPGRIQHICSHIDCYLLVSFIASPISCADRHILLLPPLGYCPLLPRKRALLSTPYGRP